MKLRAILVVGCLLAACTEHLEPRLPEAMTGATLEASGSSAEITATGAVLRFAHERATFALRALGRAHLLEVGDAVVARDGETIELRRGPVTEWWRSLPTGLEHGVTLDERPDGAGALVLDIEVGGLRAEPLSDDAVVLADASGEQVATYAQLVVLDSDGLRVPARMAAVDGSIRIEVDDEGARYPIVVDPLLYATSEATLLAAGAAMSDTFGNSVAISDDGTRALVGALGDDTAGGTDWGSARVFVRSGSSWIEEATLVGEPSFGSSVALSADGTRALVGAFGNAGSASVFLRTGTSWAEEAVLRASGGVVGDYFGIGVDLTPDGTRAVVGAFRDDVGSATDAGSARVFVRTGTTWVEEGTLTAPGGAANDYFGRAVALSADGSRVIVGAEGDDTAGGSSAGSSHVFVRTGSTWAHEAMLVAPDGATNDELGYSVALSADASRALVGARQHDAPGAVDGAGSARMFVRTGSTWTQEAALYASDPGASDFLGHAVALSADGSRALVGAHGDDRSSILNVGSARLFARVGTTWTEQATLVAASAEAGDSFGYSVALTGDASRAIVGAFWDDTAGGTNAGSAHLFTILPGAANGSACGNGAQCLSGFCVDGVCCDSACGGGTTDCQACSASAGGTSTGTCTALTATAAPSTTCRASADACDAAETCAAGSTACPADALSPSGTTCRAATDACDAVETCTGLDAACPDDRLSASGVVCRTSTGACDIAETCDGTRAICPGDTFSPAGTACGGTVTPGTCAGAGLCNGTSAICPSTTVRPAGAICLPAAPGVPCDVDDFCDGVTSDCLARYAPATAACGSIITDVCDAPDHCSGTSADCVFEFLSSVECRPSTGACDPAEVCSGTAAACPVDLTSPSGTVCRTSTDLSCDPLESCDGTATACPADVNTCAPRPDGGPELDAPSVAPDAGAAPPAVVGCACRAGAATSGGMPSVALAAVIGVAMRSRRRARSG